MLHLLRSQCDCKGSGWYSDSQDLWSQCPHHWNGQVHPENYDDSCASNPFEEKKEMVEKTLDEMIEFAEIAGPKIDKLLELLFAKMGKVVAAAMNPELATKSGVLQAEYINTLFEELTKKGWSDEDALKLVMASISKVQPS